MKNFLAYFFTFLTFFVSFHSCAPDTNVQPIAEENLTSRINTQEIISALGKVDNHFEMNRNSLPNELTQEYIDDYLVIMGYNPGEFTVSDVEEVIERLGISSIDSVEAALVELDLQQFTIDIIEQIKDGNYIDDLSSMPDYQNLDIDEKEILDMANALLLDDINNNRGCQGGASMGALIGVALGSIFGPLGAVAGAVVGGMIGCEVDGGKGR